MKKKNKLIRQQLELTLQKFRSLLYIPVPPKGWIRAVRDALGLNGRQLADRLNVSRQRAAMIEKDELMGSATLKTMRRVAESLDCIFVYSLVPRTTLEQTLRDQAKLVAQKRLARVSHTMMLENQEVGSNEQKQVLDEMINELIDNLPSTLWDENDQS